MNISSARLRQQGFQSIQFDIIGKCGNIKQHLT